LLLLLEELLDEPLLQPLSELSPSPLPEPKIGKTNMNSSARTVAIAPGIQVSSGNGPGSVITTTAPTAPS
ncbi:hypothetical protein DSI41_06795, partial [Mycobacterium tuberculosis]